MEEIISDYRDSSDLPEELRMVHRFLREANLIKLKHKPNYERFKKMARAIFKYVGLQRMLDRVAKQ